MANSRIEEVIVTTSSIGDGTGSSPYRQVTEYFSKDGSLLFKRDEWELTRTDNGATTPACPIDDEA